MIWHSWSEFWAMGGRGFYVWGSYGVCLVLLVAEVWASVKRRRATIQRLKRLQQLESE